MLDKTNIDFNYSIEQIKKEIPAISFPQDTLLDSEKMNTTFQNMEDSLNRLIWYIRRIYSNAIPINIILRFYT